MLILKKIKLENLLSHAKTEIEFKESQKLLVNGRSGAGKSAIVEGIIWGLYGQGRSDNRALIKNGKSMCKVTIWLVRDDKEYRIERSISDKNKHDLKLFIIDGKKISPAETTGVKDTQDFLEKEILKSSYQLFINSVAYPQDNPETFVKQPAAKRKDIILEMVKSSDYDTYLEKAKKTLNQVSTEFEVNTSLITSKKELLKDQAEKIVDQEKLKKEEADSSVSKSSLEKLVIDYEKNINELNDKLITVEKEKSVILSKERRVNEIKSITSKLNEVIGPLELKLGDTKFSTEELVKLKEQLTISEKKKEALYAWKDKFNKILEDRPAQYDYEADIDEIGKQMMVEIKREMPECHKCGEPYKQFAELRRSKIAELQKLTDSKTVDFNNYKKLITNFEENIKLLGTEPVVDFNESTEIQTKISNIEGLKQDTNTLEESKKQLVELSKELEILTSEISILEKKANTENELIIMQKTNFNGKLDDARSKLFEVSSTLLSVSMKLQTIKDASELIDQTKKEVKEMNSKNKKLVVDKESLELILLAFGQKGIRSMVIDYVVPQLEEKINNILAKLSDFRVIIDTQKSGLSKDTVLEGLFIDVVNERGEIFNFDNYSGGEKLKIVIAISEALSEIQNIGFRILDEVFFALDDESLEKFAEVMLALQERFPQLICISHLKNIKDLFDDQIEIVKINGDSIIK